MPPELSFVERLIPDFVAAAATIVVVILFLKHLRTISADSKTAAEIQAKVFTGGLEMILAESKRFSESLVTEYRRTSEAIVARLVGIDTRLDKNADATARMEQALTTKRLVKEGLDNAKEVVDPKKEE